MPTRWESGDVAVTSPSPKRKGKPSKPTYYAPSGPSSYKRAVPAQSTYTPAATSSKPQTPTRVSRAKIRRARKTKDIARAQQTIRELIRDPKTMRARPKLEAKVQRDLGTKKKIVVDPGQKEELKLTPKAVHVAPKAVQRVIDRKPLKLPEPQKPPKAKRPRARPAPKKPPVEKVRRQFKQGKRLLPGLDKTQTKVAATVLQEGIKAGATKKELLAAAETGIVESNFTNYTDQALTDLDSLGWRQERTSQYGTENATDVKGGAQRFFAESVSDTGGTRGKGQTAGQLAQTIQGSAFPERYDQVKAQAKPIVKAFVRGKPLPGVPKKAPGPWAGSQRKVLEVIPKEFRPEGKNDKRTPEANAAVDGSSTSDHLTTNEGAYAADLPADDALAKSIAKKLGMASHTGTNEVTKDGYRYQLIWQDEGHYDHIHLGATWTGESAPPGTSFGGTVSGAPVLASTGTSASPLAVEEKGAKTSKGAKKRKVKKQDARERMALLRRIIAEGNPELPDTLEGFSRTTPTYDARERKVTLSL